MFIINNGYIENNVYKEYGNRTFNNTNNTIKHINNYSNDVTDNYKIVKTNNIRTTFYSFNEAITLNKTSNTRSNGTYIIIQTNNTFNTTDIQYFTQKINNTSNITNNITRHKHNNYEHNMI